MSLSGRVVIAALHVLPQKWLSHLAGVLMGVPLPAVLGRAAVRMFATLAGAKLHEVKEPIASFTSVQAFFVRALKDGARPIDGATNAFVSPCDGAWGASGRVDHGTLLQVKGRSYPVAALLDDAVTAARFDGGSFATLYLSPKDYHRFHAPCDGDIVGARHVPGALWPVNAAGISYVDGLFAKNERVIALLRPHQSPDALIAMVAVGATMVGKVRVTFDDLTTNNGARASEVRSYDPPKRVNKGEEWGRFEFGSTIVLLATAGALTLDTQAAKTALTLGERIATFAPRS